MVQQGRSLHIGLNTVDAQAYQAQGWVVPTLRGCVNDAVSMQLLASDHFKTQILTDDQATSSEVIRLIASYGRELEAGDMFLLTYSGHGGQVPDVNGDEDDGFDETWVLYDRMVIDDELFQLFGEFQPGVRILMISDSCHSGTVARHVIQKAVVESYRQVADTLSPAKGNTRVALPFGVREVVAVGDEASSRDVRTITRVAKAAREVRFRGLPTAMSRAFYQQRKRDYDTFQYLAGRPRNANFGPALILLSGCQDNQLSLDGDEHGLFTQNLLDVWNAGFSGDYRQFWSQISSNMPSDQTPNFFTLGDVSAFEQEQPFAVVTQTFDPAGPPPKMAVEGSASRARTASAPNFRVDTQGAPYYVVEFATAIELFDATNHENDRTTENFWASWSESPVMRSEFDFYPMPNSVWASLNAADQIYYRVGTTTAEEGYPDYRVSTDDAAQDGPSLAVF